MSEHEIPPPAELPIPSFADVSEATHLLLLEMYRVQAHSQPTAYIISARAMVVNALSQVQAHYAVIDAQEAAAAAQGAQ